MIIYVDGDSCPVIPIIKDICNSKDLKYMVISDYNHDLKVPEENRFIVDCEQDEADLYIANRIESGDFLITNDMGLASMVLGKKVTVLNFNGDSINLNNIDVFLFQRHVASRERRVNIYNNRVRKRCRKDDESFKNSLLNILDGR
ncbi:DUF188 domain-containing protein [Lagierella massiliensis]|uniref:DUF188 domain-containing protein n=1 Tax=Lagierella massiliensis TaxID=1689303 RepID=UPI0006D77B24|nr:DUF188 domain-containing protein [Lagierella massiliensis]